jgi:hypothetical protein
MLLAMKRHEWFIYTLIAFWVVGLFLDGVCAKEEDNVSIESESLGGGTDTLFLSMPYVKSGNDDGGGGEAVVLLDDELEPPALFSSLVASKPPIVLQNPEPDYKH